MYKIHQHKNITQSPVGVELYGVPVGLVVNCLVVTCEGFSVCPVVNCLVVNCMGFLFVWWCIVQW